MHELSDMLLMHKDTAIAKINGGILETVQPGLMPYFLARTGDIVTWLRDRAIDSHRTNSRLLKRTLRLQSKDDLDTVLYVHGATITDHYWIKRTDEAITYQDVQFKTNIFDKLALYGDVNSLEKAPAPTPELTNIGSFEKCWTRKNGSWYMMKAGTPKEQFSELFAYRLGRYLGFDMAVYQYQDGYVISKDFTENGRYDFDPADGFVGDETDYLKIYNVISELCPQAANAYIDMCYLDALVYNFDRHEYNFGLLRDSETGQAVKLAPLFDHNLSLISRGYRESSNQANDRIVTDFVSFIKSLNRIVYIKPLDRLILNRICKNIPIPLQREANIYNPRSYVIDFVLSRQASVFEKCKDFMHTDQPLLTKAQEPEL